jgi:hypothetical protein
MNTQYARKIVQDNNLDITIKGRTNGIIKVLSTNEKHLATFNELLNGMDYQLSYSVFPTAHHFITGKAAN